jgi:protein disulfide-isomerase A1
VYAPWCGHCKRLAPEYASAAKALKADGIRIAKVDGTEAREVASRLGVQGFPTLKFYRGGAPAEYNGPREAAGIISWVKKHSGPATTQVASAAELAALADSHEVVVIGFAAPGGAVESVVNKVAPGFDDVTFALTNSDEARAAYDVPAGKDAVVLVNKFPGQANRVPFEGEAAAEALRAFVEANSLPLVIPFSQENAPKIFRGAIKTHFLVFVDEAAAGTADALAAAASVAAANSGKLLVVSVDPSQDRVMGYFGVTAADMPTAVLVNMPEGGNMQKFAYPKESGLGAEAMKAFVASYFDGSLKPFLKSEPAPPAAENAAAPVKTVVGTNFAELVLDPSKDVLLEFYAPWCGHCKSLAPEYEKLGKTLADGGVSSVVIAKIDATANEVEYPGVNVKGFPTLIFFPATEGGKEKTAVEYDGARDVDGFVSFLQKHATHPFSLGDKDEL